MNKEDYEKYYQKGGSYIIPVEIFNELFDEYECFKNDCQKYKEVIDKVRNNLEKDISVIKNVKMSNKEIICRLEETNKMLKEVSE